MAEEGSAREPARNTHTDRDAREVAATREAVIFPGVGHHEGGGGLRGPSEIGMGGEGRGVLGSSRCNIELSQKPTPPDKQREVLIRSATQFLKCLLC